MNTIKNIKENKVTDGVATPLGTLYAVRNGEALEVYLKQDDRQDYVRVVTVEHLSSCNQLGAIVYNDVYDRNSTPQVLVLDTDKKTDEEEIVFTYIVHTIEVKDKQIVSEYREFFDNEDEAMSQFVADVICEQRAFDYDRVIGVEIETTEKSWFAYLKGKKDTDYKHIFIEEFPQLVRVVK